MSQNRVEPTQSSQSRHALPTSPNGSSALQLPFRHLSDSFRQLSTSTVRVYREMLAYEEVFKDSYFELYTDHLVIKNYYFPWGHLRVDFSQIKEITAGTNLRWWEAVVWGHGFSLIWWARDWRRFVPGWRKRAVILTLHDGGLAKGFSTKVGHKHDIIRGTFESWRHKRHLLTTPVLDNLHIPDHEHPSGTNAQSQVTESDPPPDLVIGEPTENA